MIKNELQLVIFDMDGVILDSEHLKAQSYAEALFELSNTHYKKNMVIEAFKTVVGSSREAVVNYLCERFPLDKYISNSLDQKAELIRRRLKIYHKTINNKTKIRESQHLEIVNLIKWLSSNKVPVCIATMSQTETAHQILKNLGILDLITIIKTRDDVQHPKPSPEIYLSILEETNTSAVNSLAVEDSMSGIKAALEAKINTLVLETEMTKNLVSNTPTINKKNIFSDQSDLANKVKSMFI